VTSEGIQALSYAVRPRVVVRYLGDLCLVAGLLSLPPLLFAALSREWALLPPLAGQAAALAGGGWWMRRRPAPERIQTNEAVVIASAIFLVSPVVGSLSMMASGLAPLDALFEAISAVTTTGLSTLPGVEGRPRTFLFTRAWMQWYGGLGIVVLSLSIVTAPGVASRRLGTVAEAEDLPASTRLHARRMLGIYVLLTLAGGLGLWLLGADGFDAGVYALAAVSTGGFAPHDASLAGLERAPLEALVVALAVCGAITLPLYHRARLRGPRALFGDLELRSLLVLGAGLSALLAVLWTFRGGADATQALWHAPLMAFSAQTTAGFSSVPVAGLDSASKLALIVAMSIGGSVGSTAGGIKLFRLLIAIDLVRWTLVRTRLPTRAVAGPRLGAERLEPADVQRALVVIGAFLAAALASWFAFLLAEYPALDALFEVVSALGTVGLSAGIVGPELPAALKGVLCIDMLLGRLEIIAILVLLSPGTWFGRRAD
jgi:trk system potassium uptake protein TrkH